MRTIQSNARTSRSAAWTLPALVILVLLAPALTLGQEVTAAITGRVMDPSGAALPSATVTAKDVDRGTSVKTQTNSEGAYNLPRLPIGKYEVRGEATGFQTAVQSPFALELHQPARLDC